MSFIVPFLYERVQHSNILLNEEEEEEEEDELINGEEAIIHKNSQIPLVQSPSFINSNASDNESNSSSRKRNLPPMALVLDNYLQTKRSKIK